MIYIKLFFTFLEIGMFSFGGGYGMISVVRDAVLSNGWLSEGEFLDLIAVSESTPGPLAINMATFVGSVRGGFAGALCATLGVVLPSFVIILAVAAAMRKLYGSFGVNAVLAGVRPCIAAMILSSGIIMFLSVLFKFKTFGNTLSPDYGAIGIFAFSAVFSAAYKLIFKKSVSPILLLLLSAALGTVIYGLH